MTTATRQTCGGYLINAKDVIHNVWFDLQTEKRTQGDDSYLRRDLLVTINQYVNDSLDQIHKCSPDNAMYKNILIARDNLREKLQSATPVEMEEYTFLKMPKETAREILITDINRLANYIHQAGQELIKVQGTYCGCEILGEIDMRSINTGVLNYCEGTLKLGHKRGHIMPPGNKVEHKPGAVQSHAFVVDFEQGEEGYDVNAEYTESGDSAWRVRKKGVQDMLESKGLVCQNPIQDLSMKCKGSLKEDDIREVALMISQLKDIDLLPEGCIDQAFDYAKKQADRLLTWPHKEEIWNISWDRASESVHECVAEASGELERERQRELEREDRETERKRVEARDKRREEARARERKRVERLNNEIDHHKDWAQGNRKYAATEPCVKQAYHFLNEATSHVNELFILCPKLPDDSQATNCHDYAVQEIRENERAAKDLIQRCPPVPIMLGLEADLWHWALQDALSEILGICLVADNDECKTVHNQIIERSAKGIKPQLLLKKEGS